MPAYNALVPDYDLDDVEHIDHHSNELAESSSDDVNSEEDIENALSTIDTSAVDIELVDVDLESTGTFIDGDFEEEWDATENFQQFEQTLNSIPSVFFESAVKPAEAPSEQSEDSSEEFNSSKMEMPSNSEGMPNLELDPENTSVGVQSGRELEAPGEHLLASELSSSEEQSSSSELSVFDTLSNPVVIDADVASELPRDKESSSSFVRVDEFADESVNVSSDEQNFTGVSLAESETEPGQNESPLEPVNDQTNQELRRAFTENISFAGHLVEPVTSDDFDEQKQSATQEKPVAAETLFSEELGQDFSVDLNSDRASGETNSQKTTDTYIVEIGDVTETVTNSVKTSADAFDSQHSATENVTSHQDQAHTTDEKLKHDSDATELKPVDDSSSDDTGSSELSALDITSKVLIREMPVETSDEALDVVAEPVKKPGFVKRWANRVVSWIKRFVGF